MSYMALYRKFRPDTFDEVKGQDHIVTTLKNQIKYNRIGHAYLFCGTRGTGKTTVAKILAKTVNCEHPIDGNPCNKCASCVNISKGIAMNVIEIDAASNNGVDNIRQIKESVRYSPTQGKFLVYIIDEAHMLTNQSFNALLKTIEEPPEYVMFILATTESHKIPITILSRCQKYDFRRISVETISERLTELLQRENTEADREAVDYVARAADGSMRDALSILDRCISFNMGEKLTYEQVLSIIGAVDVDVFARLTEAVGDDRVVSVVDIINEIVWQGNDITQFVNDYIWFIRNMLFIKMSPDTANSLDMTSENVQRISLLAEKFSEEDLIRYINILQKLASDIKYSTRKRVSLEMAVLKMCRPQMENNYEALIGRLEVLEKKAEELDKLKQDIEDGKIKLSTKENIDSADVKEDKFSNVSPEEKSEIIKENLRASYPKADYEELMKIVSLWDKKIVKEISPVARNYIKKAKVVAGKDAGNLYIVLYKTPDNELAIEYFEQPENIQEIERVISELTERDVKINVQKVSPKEAVNADYENRDISKIKFKIEYEN